MLKAALFSMDSISSNRIFAAMQKYFGSVDHFDIRKVEVRIGSGTPRILYKGCEIKNSYDCVYLKSSFRFSLMLKTLATFFQGKAYMPSDPESFTIVNDKIFTHIALEKAGVSSPETYITSTVSEAKRVLKELKFPIIIKTPGGTHGKGVMYAESFAAAASILDTMSELRQTVLLQEYIETGGCDIRAIVVGDRVAASMARKAVKEEKRANLHAGGVAEPVELDANTKKIAVQAAKALNSEICGIDILQGVKGPLVIEANLSPGMQGIMKATGKDVANEIAKFLFKKSEEFRKTGLTNAEAIVKEVSARSEQQIITSLDFRGERILLPVVATKLSGLGEQDVVIRISKGRVEIEKSR
jgi:ribosomal protein S6--L-glutamate ligase